MAAAAPLKGLSKEATCPVCLEYFKDPVTTDCGHSFCRACLTQCLGGAVRNPSCPLCKTALPQGNFRPNRQLANIAEYVKQLQGDERTAGGKWGVCETHEESLKLFCMDDKALICVVCDKSKEHQGHRTLPIEEAAQEYKEKIKVQLNSVKAREKHVLDEKMDKDEDSMDHMKQLVQEKQKIIFAFEDMEKFLEKQKSFWLTKLEDVEKNIQNNQEKNATQISEEISHLSNLIKEMEEKCQQPASEFLQDIRMTLSRYEKEPVPYPRRCSGQSVWRQLRNLSWKNSSLAKIMENHKESLEQEIKEDN